MKYEEHEGDGKEMKNKREKEKMKEKVRERERENIPNDLFLSEREIHMFKEARESQINT